MEVITAYFTSLLDLSREMAPFLLLGFLVAGLLHVYVPRTAFTKYFGKNNLKSVIYASLMGIPLPLCSCGVIPTGISLYKEGASKGATISFLISTPQTGVDSIMVTYSLLGLPFAIIRPIIALFTGLLGGSLSNNLDKRKEDLNFEDSQSEAHHASGNKLKRVLDYSFSELFEDIGDWLVIGLALAAVISTLIPTEFFDSVIFQNIWLSMTIVLIASVPFYVCATGSVPIAAALLLKGLNPGAVLVFLMAGPATNIATMTVISKSLGKKSLAIYLSSLISVSFLFGWIINVFFPASFFLPEAQSGHHHDGGWTYWIENITLVLFVFFLLRLYFVRMKRWFNKRASKKLIADEQLRIEVQGMTCNNCAAKVESTILNLDEVSETHADFENDVVEIKGHNMDLKKIMKSVDQAGYTFSKVVE